MDILLEKVFRGKPRTVGVKDAVHPMDREWRSGIFKEPVEVPIWLGKTNLSGDGQADLKHHGGPEKAVFAYPSEHYSYWQKELPDTDIFPGGMGENFSLKNQLEDSVSIGDIFKIGEAIIQVSQPRQPCWKPARRFKIKNLALLLQKSGRTGWYCRVLQEGYVEAGQTLTLIDRPFPYWTIEKCNTIMHMDRDHLEEAKLLSQCELLSINWRTTLKNRVEKGESPDVRKRVIGPNG
ncbi:MAG TPA: MOSC domain-containing protein [Bacillus bacterium]|uniref:MOSC domain-containing protein n=1 Tax=Siminovitchia fordii TaxID=254759 RepID=A0ABQ4K7C4_9BACI|nr:MOSC domain-containing protein [Siminovitchia fordii]GIN21506.1 MOSC domain-containing protein [Siminovitchia fordii]HBZ08882.1 MOSC domain-containing protein [Bacillus sp. (in: firmicutes)]